MEFNLYEIISQYVNMPLTAVCFMWGYLLKHLWAGFRNELIPVALLPVGIVGNLWLNQWTVTPEVMMVGICSVAAAVYLHTTGKHIVEAVTKN